MPPFFVARLYSRLDNFYSASGDNTNGDGIIEPPSDEVIKDTLELEREDFLEFIRQPGKDIISNNNNNKDDPEAYRIAIRHMEYLQIVRDQAISKHLRWKYQGLKKDCPAMIFGTKLKFLQKEIDDLERLVRPFKGMQEEAKFDDIVAQRVKNEMERRLTVTDALHCVQLFVYKQTCTLEKQNATVITQPDEIRKKFELYSSLKDHLAAIEKDVRAEAASSTNPQVHSSQYRSEQSILNNDDMDGAESSSSRSGASYFSEHLDDSSHESNNENLDATENTENFETKSAASSSASSMEETSSEDGQIVERPHFTSVVSRTPPEGEPQCKQS